MKIFRPLTVAALVVFAAPLNWAKGAPPLSERLVSPDAATRAQAAQEFKTLSPETQQRFVQDLMVAMSSEDPGIRQQATDLLKTIESHGTNALPDAKALRNDRSAEQAKERQEDLERLKKEKAANFTDLKTEMEADRKAADNPEIEAMKKQSKSDAAGLLINGLKDPDAWVRARSARRLSLMAHPPVAAIDTLSDLLSDKDAEVRAGAAEALAAYGPTARSAIPSLMKRLADPDPGVRNIVADTLKQVQAPE